MCVCVSLFFTIPYSRSLVLIVPNSLFQAPGLRILFASLIHHAREKCRSGCFTTPRINCPRNSRAHASRSIFVPKVYLHSTLSFKRNSTTEEEQAQQQQQNTRDKTHKHTHTHSGFLPQNDAEFSQKRKTRDAVVSAPKFLFHVVSRACYPSSTRATTMNL